MSETNNTPFIGYEYTTVTAKRDLESMVIDGYTSFGWKLESREPTLSIGTLGLKFKRDHKLRNKAELSRLQREFDARIREIEGLEASKNSGAQIAAYVIGLTGTAFLAGATFAVTAAPPMIALCIILAIPGFIGWLLPYFVYNGMRRKKTAKVSVLVEKQYDDAYDICERASALLAG